MRSFSGTLWVLWLSGVLAGAVTLGVRTVDCWEKNCSLLMYDRYLLQDGTKSKSKGRDEAFGADAKRGKGKGKGKGKTKAEGDCHNCSKPGHWKEDCWADGGGKEGQGPKGRKPCRKKDKSSTGGESSKGNKADATADDNEPDGVWLASTELTEDVDDWLVEGAAVCTAASESPVEDIEPVEAYTNTYDYAQLVNAGTTGNNVVDLYDSGASQHMSPFRTNFLNFRTIDPHPIRAADKRTFNAIGKGNLYVELSNGNKRTRILLKDVLYAPCMGVTLVSISRLTATGYAMLFQGTLCKIYDSHKKQLGEIPVQGGLYRLKRQPKKPPFAGIAGADETLTMEELHHRLCHIAPSSIREMLTKGMIEGVKLDPLHQTMGQCKSCEHAKATRKPIGKVQEPKHREKFGDEVHTNLWGPSTTLTLGKKSYYATFTDDHTCFTHLYLLGAKSETFATYKEYETWVKTQHDTAVKRLRSDHGGEYLSEEFTKHLKAQGTEHKLTVHDTPQHNGVAERLNRTLVERVRAVVHASSLPKNLWREAIKHAVYMKNRTATCALDGKTPYEMLYGKKPDLIDLQVWGTKVWVHDPSGTKLDMRAHKGQWIGFDAETGAHRIYFEDCRTI